jgi:hypothetical protein
VSRESWLRGLAVAVITGTVTLAAACSDEDTVDTIPPPRPSRTTTVDGPQGVPRPVVTPSATSQPTRGTVTLTISPTPDAS